VQWNGGSWDAAFEVAKSEDGESVPLTTYERRPRFRPVVAKRQAVVQPGSLGKGISPG